jgi:hypothetical protein
MIMRLFALIGILLFATVQQQTNPNVRPAESGVGERDTETKTDNK